MAIVPALCSKSDKNITISISLLGSQWTQIFEQSRGRSGRLPIRSLRCVTVLSALFGNHNTLQPERWFAAMNIAPFSYRWLGVEPSRSHVIALAAAPHLAAAEQLGRRRCMLFIDVVSRSASPSGQARVTIVLHWPWLSPKDSLCLPQAVRPGPRYSVRPPRSLRLF